MWAKAGQKTCEERHNLNQPHKKEYQKVRIVARREKLRALCSSFIPIQYPYFKNLSVFLKPNCACLASSFLLLLIHFVQLGWHTFRLLSSCWVSRWIYEGPLCWVRPLSHLAFALTSLAVALQVLRRRSSDDARDLNFEPYLCTGLWPFSINSSLSNRKVSIWHWVLKLP